LRNILVWLTIGVVILGLSVPVMGTPVAAQQEKPDFVVFTAIWGSESSPLIASPGSKNLPLEVVIVNEGGPSIQTNATLMLSPPFSYAYYDSAAGKWESSNNETDRLGYVGSGDQATAIFYASISDRASDGVYLLPLSIEASGFNETLNVSIAIQGFASVKVAGIGFNPPDFFPGEQDVELEAYLINAGTSPAKNVTVALDLPKGFSPSWGNSTVHDLGALPVGTEVPVDFYFNVGSVPSPMNYTAHLRVNYVGGSINVPLSFMVGGKAALELVSVSGTNLTQGGSGQKLYAIIKNGGNYTAEDITFNLLIPNEFSGVTTDYLGELKPGQTAVVRFELDTTSGAKPMSYNLSLQETWYQNNTELPFTDYSPLQVNVKESFINSLEHDVITAKPDTVLYAILIVLVLLVGMLLGILARGGAKDQKRESAEKR